MDAEDNVYEPGAILEVSDDVADELIKAEKAEAVLEAIKKTPNGKKAAIIGEVKAERPGYVFSKTIVGGHRIIEKPIGEQIPRVC